MSTFSFRSHNTEESIWIQDPSYYRNEEIEPDYQEVYIMNDKGDRWEEDEYKGDGIFEVTHILDIFCNMNNLERDVWGDDTLWEKFYSENTNLYKYPLIWINEEPSFEDYVNNPILPCPYNGDYQWSEEDYEEY